MDGTALVEYLSKGIEFLKPAVSTVVGALMATMFLRKNTRTTEFEKIKSGLFQEAAEELLENGKLTYLEFYKCRNFLKIAKRADEYQKQKQSTNDTTLQDKLDFDWFVQFYELAGNINDEKMQEYWARLLANAVNDRNIQKKIYIDIIARLSHQEAEIIEKIYSIPFESLQHKTLLTYRLPESVAIKSEEMRDNYPDVNDDEIKLALVNLSRIGCISLGKSFGSGELYSVIHATLLGNCFYKACVVKEKYT